MNGVAFVTLLGPGDLRPCLFDNAAGQLLFRSERLDVNRRSIVFGLGVVRAGRVRFGRCPRPLRRPAPPLLSPLVGSVVYPVGHDRQTIQ